MTKLPLQELPQLESKHVAWIIDAAIENFEEKIQKMEDEIVRHTHFKDSAQDEPIIDGCFYKTRSRQEAIDEARGRLEQYRNIMLHLRAMKKRIREESSMEFAEAMKDYFSRQSKPSKGKK